MTLTALVVTTLLIIAGLYDLAVVVLGYWRGKDIAFSISRFMQWIPHRATFFVCICFYVMGHFWGFMDCPEAGQPNREASIELLLPIPETLPIPVRPRGGP